MPLPIGLLGLAFFSCTPRRLLPCNYGDFEPLRHTRMLPRLSFPTLVLGNKLGSCRVSLFPVCSQYREQADCLFPVSRQQHRQACTRSTVAGIQPNNGTSQARSMRKPQQPLLATGASRRAVGGQASLVNSSCSSSSSSTAVASCHILERAF